MKLSAALLACVALVAAVPIEPEVLAKAKALYKRHQPALAKRNNGGSGAGVTDTDILNFALQLEYLEAQYYHIAAYGTQLPQEILGGTGNRGYIVDDAGQRVPFASDLTRQYAVEIATDEENHVRAIRAALGSAAVAQPEINLSSAFSAAAQAAGIIGANETFNPFTSDVNFLAGAFLFEDVGVTAYNGAAPLISDKTVLGAAASILAVEAYHSGAIRANIIAAAQNDPSIGELANKAAAAEASLGNGKMQGVIVNGTANVVNADGNSLAFQRTPGEVLNIVYLGGNGAGGFFPRGLNGNIKANTPASS